MNNRSLSHFWAVYIAGYIAGCILLPPQWLGYLLYFTGGCLLHIFMDFLTPMGVPVLTPSRRRSISLFKTGSLKETFFTLCVFSLSVYLRGRMWLETQFPGLI
ncbi:metal-dependent hydrolase [Candidatus Desulfofervidus auxilii]|uniref:metal-dependent hydrolase n=1 Tax=Desulfofervidus auxilii TaxID=1621989 RepID=UPI0009E755EA